MEKDRIWIYIEEKSFYGKRAGRLWLFTALGGCTMEPEALRILEGRVRDELEDHIPRFSSWDWIHLSSHAFTGPHE